MRTIVSLGPLLAIVVVFAGGLVAHAALALPISELEAVVIGHATTLLALLWIADDAHRRRCTRAFDFAFLMALAFPFFRGGVFRVDARLAPNFSVWPAACPQVRPLGGACGAVDDRLAIKRGKRCAC